jgi:Kef-type K+ transport system membrane component KefB
MPLLIGIIAGAIIFSVIGAFLNERKKVNIVYTAIMSIVTIAIAYMILYFYSFVNPNAVIMCVGLLINSPYSVFVEASNYISKNSKLKNKIPVAIIIAVIGIILVLLFAIIYENSGQTIFPQGVFISALITLIALVILLFYPKRSKITN